MNLIMTFFFQLLVVQDLVQQHKLLVVKVVHLFSIHLIILQMIILVIIMLLHTTVHHMYHLDIMDVAMLFNFLPINHNAWPWQITWISIEVVLLLKHGFILLQSLLLIHMLIQSSMLKQIPQFNINICGWC